MQQMSATVSKFSTKILYMPAVDDDGLLTFPSVTSTAVPLEIAIALQAVLYGTTDFTAEAFVMSGVCCACALIPRPAIKSKEAIRVFMVPP